MLARTANSLFWMFRYLERAENTARLIDTGLRMALTRDPTTARDEWRSLVKAAGQCESYEAVHEDYTGMQVWNFMLRERDNPASILAMFRQVRDNARSARNAITGEMWEAINDSWIEIKGLLARPVSEQRVGEVITAIRNAGTRTHGAMNGTMLRQEGFHFARAGTFVERGDIIARILNIKYFILLPSPSYVGSTMDKGQWEVVLRAVSGDRAYRWLNAGRIDARGIVEFLVLDERFPRSLAFCHAELRYHLEELAKLHGSDAECDRLLRSLDFPRGTLTIDGVFEKGLHEFLNDFLSNNAAISAAIAQDYRFAA
jgi:uncharacterized alpha-E superfamily protein